jgi:drug efflux transport system permease protein
MGNLAGKIFGYQLLALVRKEFIQIRRDRRMVISLTMQPVLQMLLLGFALSANVTNVSLGVVDESKTPESRALIATLTESKSFRLAAVYFSAEQLGNAFSRGVVDAGVVIPRDYARDLHRGQPANVQFILNAINANTAAISQTYAESVVQSYNRSLDREGLHANFQRIAVPEIVHRGRVMLQSTVLYNPGLDGSWFIVTGVFGLLLVLDGSLVASTMMLKEREAGTIEQLLMLPASTSEIILSKIMPLFVLMGFMILLVMLMLKIVFHVPFQGSIVLVLTGAAFCSLAGIGIGTVIATFSGSAKQALLTSFFVNPALVTLSGVLTPIEAMPKWLQVFTALNPLTHFVEITRGSLLKASGFEELWPQFLALALLTLGLISLSVWRFRSQIS